MTKHAYIVLGHAHLDGQIDTDCHERIKTVNAVANKEDSYLILSGGAKASFPQTEAQQMLDLITWPAELVLLEEHSYTTAENAWFVMAALPKEVTLVTLVCSRPHSFRGLHFFRQAAKYFNRNCEFKCLYSKTPSYKSWFYEMRYLHHIPRNIRSAQLKYNQKLSSDSRN